MKKLVILGFGGYGKTVGDMALQAKLYDEIIYLDDNARSPAVKGYLKDFERFMAEDTEFYAAFGNNNLRVEWLNILAAKGARIATVIHPSAYIGTDAKIGRGTAVLPNAVVNTTRQIGMGCIINFGAVVDHDVTMDKGVHLCINAVVKAYNRIAPFAKIEAGSVIMNNTFK